MGRECIWITWEKQRRSIELSKSFGAGYHELSIPFLFLSFPLMRYFILAINTFIILLIKKPKLVFCQNPSIVLAGLLCIWKYLFNFKLVVDRHSNFKLNKLQAKSIKWRGFHFISKFSIKYADLTIVTNDYLYNLVNSWGGRSYVLQDKLPKLQYDKSLFLPGEKNIVFISSFSEDEPVNEVISSAYMLPDQWHIFITGNSEDFFKSGCNNKLPANIHLTGFLSDQDYVDLLNASDVVIVLTKNENTLTCGAYEALSLRKPCVLSDSIAIRSYFRRGVVYTQNSVDEIAKALIYCVQNSHRLEDELNVFIPDIEKKWSERFFELQEIVKSMMEKNSGQLVEKW